MTSHFRTSVLLLTCLVIALLVTGPVSACPTCKEGLSANGTNHMVQGYFWSILFMMSMPFLILIGLGTYMYVLVRNASRNAAAVVSPSGPVHGPAAEIDGRVALPVETA